MQYTVHAVYRTCSIQCMQYTVHAVYSTCSVQYMQYTVHAVYSTCSIQYMQYTVHAVYSTCSIQYMQYTVCSGHSCTDITVELERAIRIFILNTILITRETFISSSEYRSVLKVLATYYYDNNKTAKLIACEGRLPVLMCDKRV